jgi:branched-chain amino acid transport system permease protein
MHQALSIYILPGLVIGCVYGIGSSGLVLAYTTSGVLNLAFGAIAYAIALVFYELHTLHHTLAAWPAVILCVLVIGPALGVILWKALFQWLAGLGFVPSLIATIGLAIAVPALCLMIFNPGEISYAAGVAPHGQSLHKVGPAILSNDQMYGIAAALLVAGALFFVLRFTMVGLKMRAVFDSPSVAGLTGASPGSISNLSWAMSGALAAIAGIFLAPILGLTGNIFLSLTVASLAGALVGGLRSIPVSFGAALLIGLASSAITGINQDSSLLALGVQPSLPFLVMGATLLLRRRPITAGEPPRKALEPPVRFDRLPAMAAKVAPGAVLVLLAPTVLTNYWTGVVGIGLVYAVIFLGFTVALGHGGLLPLGQGALVGIGGFIGGGLAASDGVPLLLAVLLGGLAAVVIGAALALLGARLGSLEFGLLTLAFGLFADNFLFNWSTLAPPLVGRTFGIPSFFGLEISGVTRQYYMFAVILGLALVGAAWYRRRVGAFYTNAGRMNGPLAAATGVDVRLGRVSAFAVASFFAGIGGGLIGMYQMNLSPQNVTTATGLVWLAVVVVMGIRSFSAAVVAGLTYSIFAALLAEWLPIRLGPLSTVAFGLAALVLAQDPRGLLSLHGHQLRHVSRVLRARVTRGREARA